MVLYWYYIDTMNNRSSLPNNHRHVRVGIMNFIVLNRYWQKYLLWEGMKEKSTTRTKKEMKNFTVHEHENKTSY